MQGELFVVEKGDKGAFGFADEAEGLEFFDHAGEVVVVERLAADEFERDAEAVVDAVEFGEGQIDEGLPQGAIFGVAGLELDEFGTGLVLPGGVFLALLVGEDIDALEFVHGGGFQGLGIEKMPVAHDEDAELGAPVPEMVVPEHGVAEGAVNALEGVADDGRADVGDVHGLGDVGGRVVQDDRFAVAGPGHAEEGVGLEGFEMAREGVVGQGQVDEAGAGDLGPGEQAGGVEPGGGLFGDGAGRLAENLGGGHGGVALVVAEGFAGGGHRVERQRREIGLRKSGGERGAEPRGQDFFDRLHNSRKP